MVRKSSKMLVVLGALVAAASAIPASACPGALDTIAQVMGLDPNCVGDQIHGAIGAPLNQLNPFQQGGGHTAAPAQLPVAPAPMPPMGNVCYTDVGFRVQGPFNPLGSFCTAYTPWGIRPGTVGR